MMYIGKVSDSPNWSFPMHQHDDVCELLFVTDGKGKMTIDDVDYSVERGDIIVFDSKTLHEEWSSSDEPIAFYYCGISALVIDGLAGNQLLPAGIQPKIKMQEYYDHLKALFLFMYEEFKCKESYYEEACAHSLSILIKLIYRNTQELYHTRSVESVELRSQSIKEYLDAHYKQHLGLKEIAQHFNISTYYLSHIFLRVYDSSPIRYMQNRRVAEAKLLLLNSDYKIKDIANILGYKQADDFSRFFKTKTGLSPLQYKRKEYKKRVS